MVQLTEKFDPFQQIFSPFGPIVYRGRITDRLKEEILYVARHGQGSKNGDLAGNLEKQVTDQMSDWVLEELSYHAHRYVDRLRDMNRFTLSHFEMREGDFNTVNIKVGPPWVNVQRKGEWNPSHFHSKDFSCVIYAQVPEELKDEWKYPNQSGNSPTAGKIQFFYGDAQRYSLDTFGPIEPVENDIFIFPAWLKHAVYPFNADVERISCSTNFALTLSTT